MMTCSPSPSSFGRDTHGSSCGGRSARLLPSRLREPAPRCRTGLSESCHVCGVEMEHIPRTRAPLPGRGSATTSRPEASMPHRLALDDLAVRAGRRGPGARRSRRRRGTPRAALVGVAPDALPTTRAGRRERAGPRAARTDRSVWRPVRERSDVAVSGQGSSSAVRETFRPIPITAAGAPAGHLDPLDEMPASLRSPTSTSLGHFRTASTPASRRTAAATARPGEQRQPGPPGRVDATRPDERRHGQARARRRRPRRGRAGHGRRSGARRRRPADRLSSPWPSPPRPRWSRASTRAAQATTSAPPNHTRAPPQALRRAVGGRDRQTASDHDRQRSRRCSRHVRQARRSRYAAGRERHRHPHDRRQAR